MTSTQVSRIIDRNLLFVGLRHFETNIPFSSILNGVCHHKTFQVFVTVTDVNDNKPLFTASVYHASIVENSPSQSKVTTVEARDPDEGQFGEILYRYCAVKLNKMF